jgi:hypothetical protein
VAVAPINLGSLVPKMFGLFVEVVNVLQIRNLLFEREIELVYPTDFRVENNPVDARVSERVLFGFSL